jgi:hypothetical protein
MSSDHEEWLHKHGVKVTGHRTLRRALMPHYNYSNDPIDWAPVETTTEPVYEAEIPARAVDSLMRNESTLRHAITHVTKGSYSAGNLSNTATIAEFYIQQREKHYELLKDNQMYKDAWKEFQSIRALLGEEPYWP